MKTIAFNHSFLHRTLSSFLLFFAMLIMPLTADAQKIVTQHKVKKQETIFGISKQYGVTMDELRDANPAMRQPDFELKKGMLINIPEAKPQPVAQPTKPVPVVPTTTVGIMLPLHDINGDGRRMTEFYRGVLLAVKQLKQEGQNITVNAWNVPEGDNLQSVLADPKAARCNIIFGPLYTTQVPALSSFCKQHNIPLVIPFSINGDDVSTCPVIHQVYQSSADITDASIKSFVNTFSDCHPIFIDCNDATSKKGEFTFGLRSVLASKGIDYSITNLDNSSDEMFMRSFALNKHNVIVLNTGRSPELGRAFKRLDALRAIYPSVKISLFGYNEWFLYTSIYQDKFRQYDTYIPSVYDFNPDSPETKRLEQLYIQYYKEPMQQALPRFALTGYDQAMFFLRGINKYGASFHGLANQQHGYTPVQTPLLFDHLPNGGYKNHQFMLIHFK